MTTGTPVDIHGKTRQMSEHQWIGCKRNGDANKTEGCLLLPISHLVPDPHTIKGWLGWHFSEHSYNYNQNT